MQTQGLRLWDICLQRTRRHHGDTDLEKHHLVAFYFRIIATSLSLLLDDSLCVWKLFWVFLATEENGSDVTLIHVRVTGSKFWGLSESHTLPPALLCAPPPSLEEAVHWKVNGRHLCTCVLLKKLENQKVNEHSTQNWWLWDTLYRLYSHVSRPLFEFSRQFSAAHPISG